MKCPGCGETVHVAHAGDVQACAACKQKLGKVAHVVRWSPGVSLEAAVEKERTGAELWFPLAMIVLALAAMETFLAQWFSRPK